MKTFALTIEASDDGFLGRVTYEDNLLVEEADSVAELEEKMKRLLHDFHDENPAGIRFEREYDVSALFGAFDFLKISAVAERAGINTSQMRQYASGSKHPKPATAKKIENTIRRLAEEMSKVKVLA